MNRKLLILLLCLLNFPTLTIAQESPKSELHQRAETDNQKGNIASARFLYIRAYEDYANKGDLQQSVQCGTKATALYYRENYYKEAFDLLRRIDQTIAAGATGAKAAALHYQTSKERLQMYMKLRKSDSAREQLNAMESQAKTAADEKLSGDLLYNRAIYHYTFGQTQQGNAVFKEMAAKMTASGDYEKVDEVYQTLIANGRRSGSANLVDQAYTSYIQWKDSVAELKRTEETRLLKRQIADNETAIGERDSALSTRRAVIVGLLLLLAALAAALAVAVVVLLRFVVLTRKQRRTIRLANENNARKAQFISNISAQLEPTLRKLDKDQPEVRAMLEFTNHIQTLSALENDTETQPALEEVSIPSLFEELLEQVRPLTGAGVTLKAEAPRMSAEINREYVTHILLHLLRNAAEHTPEGGHISLEYKKRGPRSHQFLVCDTGPGIPEEQQEKVFEPFRDIRDLTSGDGLGLPICRQMALRMNGDLTLSPDYTRGARFVLELHA